MDDYDNRTPTDRPFPYADFNATLTLEESIRQAGLHLAVPPVHVDAALTYAFEQANRRTVDDQENYVIHRPRSAEAIRASEILLQVNPTETDFNRATTMGVEVTSMNVNVDPNVHPPVSQVSAPAFSGTGHKLEAASAAEPSAAAEPSTSAPSAKE
eukprot:1603902-Amphidinium_carterae.2